MGANRPLGLGCITFVELCRWSAVCVATFVLAIPGPAELADMLKGKTAVFICDKSAEATQHDTVFYLCVRLLHCLPNIDFATDSGRFLLQR